MDCTPKPLPFPLTHTFTPHFLKALPPLPVPAQTPHSPGRCPRKIVQPSTFCLHSSPLLEGCGGGVRGRPERGLYIHRPTMLPIMSPWPELLPAPPRVHQLPHCSPRYQILSLGSHCFSAGSSWKFIWPASSIWTQTQTSQDRARPCFSQQICLIQGKIPEMCDGAIQAGYGICRQRGECCSRLAPWRHRGPHESSLGSPCRLSYRFPGVSPAQFGGQEYVGEGRSTL